MLKHYSDLLGAVERVFLTAKVAKVLRRGRKEFNVNALSLRTLRNPLRALRLIDLAFFYTPVKTSS
jgi:hypothetical protein